MRKQKYGVGCKVCGVYRIINNITGDSYIGSSRKVINRLSNHFNREVRLYPHKPLYRDIIKYGFENFSVEILAECEPEQLIEQELYYYNKLNPTYNLIPPCENNFKSDALRQLAIKGTKLNHNLKEKYDSDEYRYKFRTMHVNRMKPVEMLKDDEVITEFISIREAGRWCDENTPFKAKNKASKIKSVCDGERKSAFGYQWRYKKV